MSHADTDPGPGPSSAKAARRCVAVVLCIAATIAPGSDARTAAGPRLSLAAAKHYAIGNVPCSMAIGELNGDGRPEIVTANCHATTVSVLLNRGNGAFEARRNYVAGRRPERVEIADLNGDGKNDLLTANFDRTISVLLNQGAGTFGPRTRYTLGLGPHDYVYYVLIADLNGDDKPDLVIETYSAVSGDTTVWVLLNRGEGTFEAGRDYAAPDNSRDIALGDLNGDEKPDLVIVYPYALAVLLNGGDGSFETRRDYEAGLAARVAIGDLNADGKPDLATTNEGAGGTSVLLNRGDGTFLGPRYYDCHAICNRATPVRIAIADMNGDANADLVTEWEDVRYGEPHEVEYVTEVSVLLNKGSGNFSSPRSYEIPYPESALLAVVDLNGDGKPDIASWGTELSVLLNKGAGRLEPSLYYPFGNDPNAIASADLNGDGQQDFAAALPGRRQTVGVAVRLNTPGLCNVQWVGGLTVAAARQKLGRINCRVGKITRAYSKGRKGRVISQNPRFGAVLPGGGKDNLIVSRGRRPRR